MVTSTYLLRIFKLDSTRSSGSSEARADSLARLSIVFFRPTISASASKQARLLTRLFRLIFQEKTKWEKPVSTVPFTGLIRPSPNYGEKKWKPINCSLNFLQDAFYSIVKEDTEKNVLVIAPASDNLFKVVAASEYFPVWML